MKTVIPNVIALDQMSSYQAGNLFYNMHRLFNVLYSSHSAQQAEVALSLNAKKAFDRIKWKYLLTVLERFGFGPLFITWIRLFYATPKASVWTNSICSDSFLLHHDCSLSPCLFNIAIEPLNIASRAEEKIVRGSSTHKVSPSGILNSLYICFSISEDYLAEH